MLAEIRDLQTMDTHSSKGPKLVFPRVILTLQKAFVNGSRRRLAGHSSSQET